MRELSCVQYLVAYQPYLIKIREGLLHKRVQHMASSSLWGQHLRSKDERIVFDGSCPLIASEPRLCCFGQLAGDLRDLLLLDMWPPPYKYPC